ncbi:ACT domain-containing protein [Asticcacaulis sp. 201]|uniref:ACT domain-containing protein n=1 Tax=Asticcacaulis sp. 201 TaxID=3028787 RepID=UPI00291707B3|nr:ACT domain-containing protein [Asticcacaulis sp. 201]MDV6332332.1 ACT domain-containing protein [Asticcacaulis sp. 201]
MSHLIHIELDRLEGSLLRILGLVERRGFNIDGAELYDLGEDKRGLSLTVRPRDLSRSLDILGLQIDRLYGIKRLASDPRGQATPSPTEPKAKINA